MENTEEQLSENEKRQQIEDFKKGYIGQNIERLLQIHGGIAEVVEFCLKTINEGSGQPDEKQAAKEIAFEALSEIYQKRLRQNNGQLILQRNNIINYEQEKAILEYFEKTITSENIEALLPIFEKRKIKNLTDFILAPLSAIAMPAKQKGKMHLAAGRIFTKVFDKLGHKLIGDSIIKRIK
jgi:hypothetical protein